MNTMESKSVIKVFGLFLLAVSMPVATFAQQQEKEPPKPPSAKELKRQSENATLKIPHGAGFFIQPIEEAPNNFSLLLSDADNRSVATSFTLNQIQIFEAVLIEAKKFAEGKEAVGTVDFPMITRFVDNKERSLIIDVEKAGIQSRFYITLNCLTGRVTVDAGAIKRDGKEHQTLFNNFLSRIQVLKTMALTPQD
jgi:hypothetical protein